MSNSETGDGGVDNSLGYSPGISSFWHKVEKLRTYESKPDSETGRG